MWAQLKSFTFGIEMKRLVHIILLACIAACNTYLMAQDKTGKDGFSQLWARYNELDKADKPAQAAAVLREIREHAADARSPYDFYRAGSNYVSAVSSRNWKEREGALEEFASAVKEFDYPIVTYLWLRDYGGSRPDIEKLLEKDRESLAAECNSRLYAPMRYMNGRLPKYIVSDYEFILWDQYLSNRWNRSALEQCIGEGYPKRAFLEYFKAMQYPESSRGRDLEKVVEKYPHTAISLYAREELLLLEFYSLGRSDSSESEDYQDLYKECKTFLKDKKRLSGDEAAIAGNLGQVEDLCKTLTRKTLEVSAGGDTVAVAFSNLGKAAVTMYRYDGGSKGPSVKSWKVKNGTRSFYLKDTETMVMPANLDDGEYLIEAAGDGVSADTYYRHHTISLAWRKDSDGYKVYAASWLSGESLPEADFFLCKGRRVLMTETIRLNGFTRLPEDWEKKIEKNDDDTYSFFCSVSGENGITRRSPDVLIRKTWLSGSSNSGSVFTRCRVFRDRGAYNPGDVLRFKAIVFKGNLVDRMDVLPDAAVSAVLYNAEGKEIERKEFTSNEFGSVAGEFQLPVGQKNGDFSLAVLVDGQRRESQSFRVDNFVLPTFDLKFEAQDSLYMPGETVKVKGKVSSYSGHTLTGANINFRVLWWGDRSVYETKSAPEEDGSFTLSFPVRASGVYVVEAKVTDATGETQDFRTWLYISDIIHVNINPLNGADGSFVLTSDNDNPSYRPIRDRHYVEPPRTILRGGNGIFELYVTDSDGDKVPGTITYKVTGEDKAVRMEGSVSSGDRLELDFSSLADGLYYLDARCEVDGGRVYDNNRCIILKQEGAVIDAPVRRVFAIGKKELLPGEDIRVFFGSADGPTWAVVTLFGDCNQVLETRLLHLEGERGKARNSADIAFPYKESYPEAVRLSIFYFKYGREISWSGTFTLRPTRLDLPLAFSSFTDESAPGTLCTFTLETAPGAEALVAVFDKSIDAIAPNEWPLVKLRGYSAKSVHTTTSCGSVTGLNPFTGDVFLTSLPTAGFLEGEERLLEAEPVYSEARGGHREVKEGDIPVRTSFRSALFFEPFLRADENGRITFSFRTSDKLSTYYVQVFAHDKEMKNATVRREMLVTMPVKVSMAEPLYLYEGDILKPSVSVSNNSDKPVPGTLTLYVYPGEDTKAKPVSVKSVPLTVPARGVKAAVFNVPAAGNCRSLKAVFSAGELSDAMLVTVPVYGKMQTLTESHSAVLLAGSKKSQVVSRLRKEFVNTPGAKAELSEISILDMVREAIPAKKKPYGSDVLSLTEAYYVRLLAAELDGKNADETELLEKILACRNADGGFGWFQGMPSSLMITAVVMERFSRLERAGFEVPDISSSASFLDSRYFMDSQPYWCGWISDAQYMYARSLYPEVPFNAPSSKILDRFKDDAPAYLTPSKDDGRGLKGRILDKARRMRTLQNLAETDEGLALAKAWGIKGGKAALKGSMDADVESLLDYAVKHRDGGWYYPNAVMPWRGLLETEAYAHSLICDLMSTVPTVPTGPGPMPYEVADGIRIWLMLQKETQKWGDEPAFVDALTSIMMGRDEVLGTKVLVLKADYTKPFVEVKASGNGFTLDRKFFDSDTGAEIRPGDVVPVGTKITARYVIWNQENRSFVRLSATREASLRPADQLSGLYGLNGYRDVRPDRTEYWFDSYPEENTTIEEDFFVTQAGTFRAPVITVESLYAPHYRANAGFGGPLQASW